MKHRALIELRELLRLALPLAAAQLGMQLMGVVDTAVVGRLGAQELGAVGLGNALFFTISILGMGIVMGIEPMVSQAFGAGDPQRARRVLWQGVWLAFISGGILSVPLFLAPLVLAPIGVDPGVIAPTTAYTIVRTFSLIPFLLFLVLKAYLQAQSITRPMIVATVLANIFNLGADILFVFGGSVLPEWAGPLRRIPAMGVAGAAVATVACAIFQLAVLVIAVRQVAVSSSPREHRRYSPVEVRQAFRIGLPLGLQLMAEVGVFALVAMLAGKLGARDLAAHQIAIQLASLTFMVALGVASAGAVRVGRAIGAADQPGTRLAGLTALATGAAVMTIGALCFLFFPRQLALLLTNKEDVIAAAVPLLIVAAVFQLSDGTQAAGAGVLRGAADTRFAFVANLIGHWFIGLPIAILLGFTMEMGIVGLWWGLCVGLTAVAALLFIRFFRLSSRLIQPVAG
jgi:MATE family multidrug resistance protein